MSPVHPRHVDPYAARPRRIVIRARLPEGRLSRLGATEPVLSLFEAVWSHADDDARTSLLEDIAVLSDTQLAGMLDAAADLPAMGVNPTMDWVRGCPQPELAAALTGEAELRRPEPRRSMVDKLRAFSGDMG
jgi:hypothetical protein